MVFQDARNTIDDFAEDHWQANESQMENGWKRNLKRIQFKQRLETAMQEAVQYFQQEVQEEIEEIGKELKLISEFEGEKYSFSKQDTSNFNKQFFKIGGSLLSATLVFAILFFPAFAMPLGIISTVLAIGGSLFSGLFKSKEQKRREAVQRISESLEKQFSEQYDEIIKRTQENFRAEMLKNDDKTLHKS